MADLGFCRPTPLILFTFYTFQLHNYSHLKQKLKLIFLPELIVLGLVSVPVWSLWLSSYWWSVLLCSFSYNRVLAHVIYGHGIALAYIFSIIFSLYSWFFLYAISVWQKAKQTENLFGNYKLICIFLHIDIFIIFGKADNEWTKDCFSRCTSWKTCWTACYIVKVLYDLLNRWQKRQTFMSGLEAHWVPWAGPVLYWPGAEVLAEGRLLGLQTRNQTKTYKLTIILSIP